MSTHPSKNPKIEIALETTNINSKIVNYSLCSRRRGEMAALKFSAIKKQVWSFP